MSKVLVTVFGEPIPQGSKRIVRGRLIEANPKTAAWRKTVSDTIDTHLRITAPDWQPFEGPLEVAITFYMQRPKAHFRTGRRAAELRDDAPRWATKKPDIDKLSRAILDACTTAGVWIDDSQVVELRATQMYGMQPAAVFQIRPLEEGRTA